MNAATKFNLRSTPTIIINGKKIEGSIPTPQFFAIFDELLKK
jgi:protein-disulfide isomerase